MAVGRPMKIIEVGRQASIDRIIIIFDIHIRFIQEFLIKCNTLLHSTTAI